MKKVLIVATVQSHIAQFHTPLINLLKDNGYIIDIAARDNLEMKPNLYLSENINKIYNIPFERSPFKKNNYFSYKKLQKIIEENNYEVVHANTPVGGVISRLVIKNTKILMKPQIYYTAHGFHFYSGASLRNWLIYFPIEYYFSKYTDKLITISEEDYNLAKNKFKTDVYRISGTGVNETIFTNKDKFNIRKLKTDKGFLEEDFILLNVGELNNNKNQKIIIEAISKVKGIFPNIKLIIAGNGPNEIEIKNQIKDLKLENHVILLGYTRDLPTYYKLSNLTISVSKREGLGLNIIESIMSGTPVIASNNRGHRELVNEMNGWLLEKNSDPDSIAKLIIDIIKDRKYKKLPNIHLTVKKYTHNNVIKELKKIYEL